jgi:hypothetical protein
MSTGDSSPERSAAANTGVRCDELLTTISKTPHARRIGILSGIAIVLAAGAVLWLGMLLLAAISTTSAATSDLLGRWRGRFPRCAASVAMAVDRTERGIDEVAWPIGGCVVELGCRQAQVHRRFSVGLGCSCRSVANGVPPSCM